MTSRLPELQGEGLEICTAIGVLTLAAVSLEKSLVNLLSALGKISFERSRSLFYSTVSAKARLDMTRSQIEHSGVPDGVKRAATKALDKAKKLTDRRNEIIHGDIQTNTLGRFTLTSRMTATAKPIRQRLITSSEVWELADEYATLFDYMDELSSDISFPLMRNSWTGKYP
ncbi:hypothetical protein CSW58_12040 [Caulobacter sp. B11]|nr:hypothetical protein CSW58_12040 [Caulobacter sp. B11]